MNRRLILVRHAKAAPGGLFQSDHSRELADRGRKDAPEMGRRLKDAGFLPDLIVASDSAHTRETATLMASGMDLDAESIRYDHELYDAGKNTLLARIFELPDDRASVMIVIHNPGVTNLVNDIGNRKAIDDMPTCAFAVFEAESKTWKNFAEQHPKLVLLDFPKNKDAD